MDPGGIGGRVLETFLNETHISLCCNGRAQASHELPLLSWRLVRGTQHNMLDLRLSHQLDTSPAGWHADRARILHSCGDSRVPVSVASITSSFFPPQISPSLQAIEPKTQNPFENSTPHAARVPYPTFSSSARKSRFSHLPRRGINQIYEANR